MSVDTTAGATDASRRDAVVEQLFLGAIGALETLHVYLGDRLGLYDALAEMPDASAASWPTRAGIAERYAREWLEQQAAAGLLVVSTTRRPRRRSGATGCPRSTPRSARPGQPDLRRRAGAMVGGLVHPLDAMIEAFRTGAGCPTPTTAPDTREGIARLNRPMFVNQLAQEWLPAVPDMHARLLRADPPARVADSAAAAGGRASPSPRAYPLARVDGFDPDEASVADARAQRRPARLGDRVRVRLPGRRATRRWRGRYDLVTIFEALHDMAHPVVGAARGAALLAPGGAVLVADEKVAETFTRPRRRARAVELRLQRAALPARRR